MPEVFEHEEGQPLKPGDTDGMAREIAEDEAAGIEGEHIFDAAVEDPPHPFWDKEKGRCRD